MSPPSRAQPHHHPSASSSCLMPSSSPALAAPALRRSHRLPAVVKLRICWWTGASATDVIILRRISKKFGNLFRLAVHFSRAKAAEKMVVGKGTPAFGQRNDKSHTLCRRCGKRSYHIQKKKCASCGFPSARVRHCTCFLHLAFISKHHATHAFQPSFLSFLLACFINFAFHFIQIVLFLVRYFQMPCIDASLQTIGQRRLRVAAPPAPDVLVSFPPFVPSC